VAAFVRRPSRPRAAIAVQGQARSRMNLWRLLKGSALHNPDQTRFLQDPLSFRSITQIHGAGYEVWEWTKTQFELEINSSADNPLVDLQSGELFTSSSMVSLLPALAMDSLRQALAKVSVQSMERALKLQSPPFTGLPVGLAAEDAADGGILSLNLNYIGSARMGSPAGRGRARDPCTMWVIRPTGSRM